MTENKYLQLKKRVKWLTVILRQCSGTFVPSDEYFSAYRQATHFLGDCISKIQRYEVSHGEDVSEYGCN